MRATAPSWWWCGCARAAVRHDAVGAATPFSVLAVGPVRRQPGGESEHEPGEHRDVDLLALAGDVPRPQPEQPEPEDPIPLGLIKALSAQGHPMDRISQIRTKAEALELLHQGTLDYAGKVTPTTCSRM